ncbi:unnamed protein product, partial [Adineta ricciae]
MELNVGRIVWARRTKDDIYWPAKITIVSSNTSDLWSSTLIPNYHVHFFVTNQTTWVTDLLPYQQYRDSMTNESFMNYGLHPTIKPGFVNAIHQADYAISNEAYANASNSVLMTIQSQVQPQSLIPAVEHNTNNDFLLATNPMAVTNTNFYNPPCQQIATPSSQTFSSSNNHLTTTDDWYAQQGLLVESITPPLPLQNDNPSECLPPPGTLQTTNTVVIITTKTYSNPPFISFIFNSLSTFFHTSLIYVEHLPNYQHSSATSLTYLICFDQFDASLQHTLDATILNNLSAHVNYHFLLVNAPCQSLVKHLYTRIMDQRSILVVDYRSTFDDDALLLCSGNRETYEMLRP